MSLIGLLKSRFGANRYLDYTIDTKQLDAVFHFAAGKDRHKVAVPFSSITDHIRTPNGIFSAVNIITNYEVVQHTTPRKGAVALEPGFYAPVSALRSAERELSRIFMINMVGMKPTNSTPIDLPVPVIAAPLHQLGG